MLVINLEREDLVRNEEVRGIVSWTRTKEPEEVSVALRWFTEGRGDTNSGIAASITQSLEGAASDSQRFAFGLTVPADAMPSYDGRLLRFRWQVVASLKIPWGIDPSAEADIRVSPR